MKVVVDTSVVDVDFYSCFHRSYTLFFHKESELVSESCLSSS